MSCTVGTSTQAEEFFHRARESAIESHQPIYLGEAARSRGSFPSSSRLVTTGRKAPMKQHGASNITGPSAEGNVLRNNDSGGTQHILRDRRRFPVRS